MSIRRVVIYLSLAFLAVVLIGVPFRSQLSSQGTTQTPTVLAGRNVNMVSGTTLPGGDPWLQRQNEPTIAVSSRNPMHLLAGANDYRTVDMPTSEGELPGKTPVAMVGDAWLGVFTSSDGGESWTSTMLPGFPQDPNPNNPLKAYGTASDPVVRSGPNGIFYYSGIAFNRTTNLGVVFVARFIDNNNSESGNTIQYIDTTIIATGIEGSVTQLFLDKPWIAVDQPRAPMTKINVAGQSIPRHNVYIAYSAFSGKGSTVGNIMFARSSDCGTTWGAPIKISTGSFADQGATIAIKPVLGEVLVAWRRFSQAKTPDSIFVALSGSGGLNFGNPIKVADITPLDQPTTDGAHSLPGTANGYAFRINSYPTITVDKSGHVYLAWSQRPNSGYARIMLSYSYLGLSWSTPQPVANLDENGNTFLGHQIMPSFSFSAGKLMLVWYDQRHDVSGNIYGFNSWIIDSISFLPGFPYRHTMDVWAAMADTAAFPNLSWKSAQVSRYLYAATYDSSGNPTVYPVQFNCVNYPLFKGGTNPFDGDYIDVAASPSFRLDSWRNWIFNTDSSNSPEFHVAWTDNRDVRPPVTGNWTLYNPPSSTQNPMYVTSGRPECGTFGDPNGPGMRNQNIYTSRITWGIEAGSPVNDKPLSLPGSPARAFVVYVKNNTQSLRSFALTIAAQPVGGQASFLQFGLLASLNVDIAPYSTISRPVFISSSDPSASVTVNINEINASGGIITGGLTSSVLINGDPTNPNPANPSTDETHDPSIVSATPNIVNWYVNPNIVNPNIVNPNIVNPNIVNPNIVNPNIVNTDPNNPNIVNPNIVNPNIVNPNIVNPNIVNPNIVNPNIVNPNIVNPNIVNPNIVNAAPADVSATDVQWTVTNAGSATTSYTLKTLAKMSPPEGVYAQLLVYRVHYTPAVAGAELSSATGISACTLMQEPHQELVLNVLNPNIVNPNIVNPNIVNPNIVNSSIEDATFSVAPGEEIIVDLRVLDTGVSSMTTTSAATMKALSATTSTQALTTQEFIHSLGFAVTSQAVNSTDVAAGSQIPPAAATALVIGTGSLPDGVAGTGYSATLRAYGGTGNYVWSLNSGALPPGLSLVTYNGGGLISGTPTTAGTSHFIVRVDDGIQFDTQQYYIVINSATGSSPLAIVTTALPSGVQGNWYGATLEATGGVWPRTWSLASGALPNGLILDSGGVISGTPTVAGSFSFAVRVTDKNGTAVTQGLSLVIAANSMTYYAISGYVYSETGQPLAGVVLRGLPDTPVTDATGFYTDNVPAGWSGTVIPFLGNHTFTPASITYTNVTAAFTLQNYNKAAAPAPEWTWVSGSNIANQAGSYGVKGIADPSNVPTGKSGAVFWLDSSGKLWLFGGWGYDSAGSYYDYLNDLWKYDPTTNEWTWVSGSNIVNQAGTYGTQGTAASSNVPGARAVAVSWLDSSGKLWLFGGYGLDSAGNQSCLNDLWKYDPTINEWTWVSGSNTINQAGTYGTQGTAASSNVPGARQQAVSWLDSSGKLWLFGGFGADSTGNWRSLNDLWKYDPTINEWTWVSGSNIGGQVGVYGQQGLAAPSNVPGGRAGAVSWLDSSGKLWLFGAQSFDLAGDRHYFNDVWEYDPTTNEWTWVSGSNTADQAGVYGTKGTAAASNVPGARGYDRSWRDSSGKLWLFGGEGWQSQSAGTLGYFNDLWQYAPTTNEWTWVSGSNTQNQPGTYGTKGTAAASNVPGAKFLPITWIDSSGKLWLFGGIGLDSAGNWGFLNDLWQYSLALPDLVVSSLTHSPANPTTADTITFVATVQNIGNATAGPSVLSFQVGGETTPPTYNVPSLAPRATYQVTRTAQLTVAQNYQNTATADVTNIVTESNETNNVTTDIYSVSAPVPSIIQVETASDGSGAIVAAQSIAAGSSITVYAISRAVGGYFIGNVAADSWSVTNKTGGVMDGDLVPAVDMKSATFTGYSEGTGQIHAVKDSLTSVDSGVLTVLKAAAPTLEWTWVSGSNIGGQAGTYGTQGTAASSNVPGARWEEDSWIDASGKLWLFGGQGYDSTGAYGSLNDLWEYDGTNWTWVSGSNTAGQKGTYGTQGTAASSNVPGGRYWAVSWIDNQGKLWLLGGVGLDSAGTNSFLNDLWKYDGTNWTWVSGSNIAGQAGTYGTQGTAAPTNVPGARWGAKSWIDSSGKVWLFGGHGLDSVGNVGELNDLWKYDPTTNWWTWVSGSNTRNQAGIYGTQGTAASSNVPGGRYTATSWIDSQGKLWLFGGYGYDSAGSSSELNDLWKYDGTNWTWVSGSNTVNHAGIYGTRGVAAASNVPGARYWGPVAWTDASGKLWLFGGSGFASGINFAGYLNDLWKYDPTTNWWTWVSGSNIGNQAGIYGTQGTAASGNVPGAREGAVSWIDSTGNLWLFGGEAYDSAGNFRYVNDLWKYSFALPDLVVSSLTHSPANPTTADTITFVATVQNIGNATAGPSVLSFQVGGETTPPTYNVPSLAPRATYQVTRTAQLTVAQNYQNTATADVTNVVTESNEANNVTTDFYTVTTAGLPDLVVSSLTHSPANPTTADTITFVATVQNIGNATAGPSKLSFQVGGETTPPTYDVPSLAPNATYQVTRTMQLTVAQNYQNTATADATSVVAESNESNNITTDIYTVTTAPLPDLIISELWTATPSPPWSKPANPSTSIVTVMNMEARPGRQLSVGK